METVTLKVFRYDPDADGAPRMDSFTVPVERGMTVLEALFYIQRKLDGSLAFRSSCRAGVCGSCAMHINGLYQLSCEVQISLLGTKEVTVLPLAHLEILRDLVVDMEPFWAKYKDIKPYLVPSDPDPEKERIQTPDERARLNHIIDCILCVSCHSSCTVTETDREYLGPAVLMKANRFLLDSRDHIDEERIRLVDNEHGVWRCHTIFSCQEVCPKDLNPTAGIANLKREAIRLRLSRKVIESAHKPMV